MLKLIILLFVSFTISQAQGILDPAYGLWGIGGTVKDRNYKNTDIDIGISPFIFGGYGPVWIEANRLGYTFYRDGTWFASVAGLLRSHQYRKDDPGLSERKSSIELGLQIGRRLPAGFTSRLAFMHDVTGNHKSYEFDWQLYRHDAVGPFHLLSAIGIQYQNKKLVNYYYGTQTYKPANAIGGEIEFILTFPISQWAVFAGSRIFLFNQEVTNSPIVNRSYIGNYFFGLGYYL